MGPEGEVIQYKPAENVTHQNAGYNYWIDLAAGEEESWCRVYLMGEYGLSRAGKVVYPRYVDSIHCSKEPLEVWRGLPLYLGWDFGRTPCVVFIQQTPQGAMWILEEMVSEDMGIREFAHFVKTHLNNNYYGMRIISIGDPQGQHKSEISDELTCLNELSKAGIPTAPAITQNFVRRTEAVNGFLTRMVTGKPGFQLDPRCEVLREGFQREYKYREIKSSTGRMYSDEPLKTHPHSDCIAEGTPVTMADGTTRPIEQIMGGDMVATDHGPGRVTKAWLVRRNAQLFELTLENGRELLATPDHRIMCSTGWKALDEFQYGDVVYCIGEEGDAICQRNTQCSSSMGVNTTDPRPGTGTTLPLSNLFTMMSGLRPMVLFRRAMSFITRTTTQTTTLSPILNCAKSQSTPSTTLGIESRRTPSATTRPLGLRSRRHLSGTDPKRDVSGTRSIAAMFGRICRKKSAPVLSARQPSRRPKASKRGDSAPPNANPRPGETAASTMKSASALSADRSSPSTSTPKPVHAVRVVQVKHSHERRDIYDLTVEPSHCFFANGILVHNCQDAVQYVAMHLEGTPESADNSTRRRGRKRPVRKANWKGYT